MHGLVFLAELCRHRWALPILAELQRHGGRTRLAEMAASLEASRGGLRQAVDALIRLRLVARNPGHGHPLRPEFMLTTRGERLAVPAMGIVLLARRWSIEDEAFRRWPLPVVYGLGESGVRFSELRNRLPGITDRALSLTLQLLDVSRLAERIVHTGRPPSVEYAPTDRAMRLRPLLGQLAGVA
ncbi:MAG TPA: winged helix-turn-helix transcriptional regulator [Gemmatimonadaceae bacterium]|nr:winged helix-turn-helix transcriptional regulator [Gemmatimonadaceae bacterium]